MKCFDDQDSNPIEFLGTEDIVSFIAVSVVMYSGPNVPVPEALLPRGGPNYPAL